MYYKLYKTTTDKPIIVSKLSIRMKEKIKMFNDKNKIKEVLDTKPPLEKLLKGNFSSKIKENTSKRPLFEHKQ